MDDLVGAGQVDFKHKTLKKIRAIRGNRGHHDVIHDVIHDVTRAMHVRTRFPQKCSFSKPSLPLPHPPQIRQARATHIRVVGRFVDQAPLGTSKYHPAPSFIQTKNTHWTSGSLRRTAKSCVVVVVPTTAWRRLAATEQASYPHDILTRIKSPSVPPPDPRGHESMGRGWLAVCRKAVTVFVFFSCYHWSYKPRHPDPRSPYHPPTYKTKRSGGSFNTTA